MNLTALEPLLVQALEDLHQHNLATLDPEDLDVVGLYTCGECSYLMPVFNTRSALKHHPSESTRWSPADWPTHGQGGVHFQAVDQEMLKGWDGDFSNFHMDKAGFQDLVVRVLRDFRERHFSGTRVLVGLFVAGEESLTS